MTGLGFIVGPITGSLLSRKDIRYPFYLSTFIFFVDAIVCMIFLPHVNPDPNLNVNMDPTCPVSGKQGECIASKGANNAVANISVTTNETSSPTTLENTSSSPATVSEDEKQVEGAKTSRLETFVASINAIGPTIVDIRYIIADRDQHTHTTLTRPRNCTLPTHGLPQKNLSQSIYSACRKKPKLFKVLIMSVLMQTSLLLIETTMLMFLQIKFGLDSKSNGFVMAYSGSLGVLINIFVVTKAIRYLGGEDSVITWALVCGAFGCTVMGNFFRASVAHFKFQLSSPLLYLAERPSLLFLTLLNKSNYSTNSVRTDSSAVPFGLAPLSLGMYVGKTALMTLMTKLSPKDKRGSYLGVSNSLDSLVRVLMPAIGGILLEQSIS